MSRKSGFTIVELLVVIAIFGILASIVYFVISDVRMKSRDIKRLAEVSQIYTAVTLYMKEYGTLPTCSDPGYAGGCDVTQSTGYHWDADTSKDNVFLEFLISENMLTDMPIDTINDDSHFYFYARDLEFPPGSGETYHFIVGGVIENPNHPALLEDINVMPGVETGYMLGMRSN